ncbi:16S rRNA (guanine(527)-N(7))-methyltransferase RsmG [Bacillaceae bacterium]
MNAETFARVVTEKGLTLSTKQADQFAAYYETLVAWNEKMNLTAITQKGEVYVKHFYDSLSLAFYFDLHSVDTLADIGAGAGFPSLPLKICFPHLQVTIIDSLQKRIGFLKHLVEQLGLDGVACLHGRAEEWGKKAELRERFDLVTARAVARFNVLSEYCLPFAKLGGWFVAMKGADASAEVAEGERALRILGGKLERIERFVLPEEEGGRSLIFVQKVGHTPAKYPRNPGTPAKNPL